MWMMEPWHWLLLGIVLAAAEMLLASFTVLWFGLGAVIVAALLWLMPSLSLTVQLSIWLGASLLFALFWFRVLKPKMRDRTLAGLSREAVLGQTGMVIQAAQGEVRGRVRFTTPLLGSDEWPFISNQPVAVGDRVQVVDVSGNTLVVE